MFDPPRTKAAAQIRRYGMWSGNPKGHAYSGRYCAYEVPVGDRSVLFTQCGLKPHTGPDDLYCNRHAKKVVALLEKQP